MRPVLLVLFCLYGCHTGKVNLDTGAMDPIEDTDEPNDEHVASDDDTGASPEPEVGEDTGHPADTGLGDDTAERDDTAEPDDTAGRDDTAERDDTGHPTDTGDEMDDEMDEDLDGDGFPASIDCDDTDPAVNPSATEICNGIDDDCNGHIDGADALDADTWRIDADGDGYGSDSYTLLSCEESEGWVEDTGPIDCDDLRAAVHPDAIEICNGLDDDCDDAIDGDAATDPSDWFPDEDGDGFGAPGPVVTACEGPPAHTDNGTDCDDTNDAVHPDASEVCNGLDDDCDELVDPDWPDSDEDGLANCVDSSVYAEDFSAGWGDWNIVDLLGLSPHDWWGWEPPEWEFVDGHLYEATNASDSVAHSPDLGVLDAYTVSAEMMLAAGGNNAVGLAFGVQNADNMLILQWMDPINFYHWTDPPAQFRLVQIVDGAWSVLATGSTGGDLSVAAWAWTELAVQIDGGEVTAYKDGTVVLRHTLADSTAIGPHGVGVWTWDNDAGAYFDDILVSNP